ncbi:MAG: RNA polymerase subunit sigma-70 [Proteobacteria bacterium]|nr:RNA polymerase subunit sigma-70 [Pseudomonadota bacterium]
MVRKEQKTDRERNRTIRSRQRAIGRELRRMYDDVAREPVPDDFLDLLKQIDEGKEQRGSGKQDA